MMKNELLAASYIRGYIISNNLPFNDELIKKELTSLTSDEVLSLINFGKEKNLKLYYFKEKEILSRVKIVLGFLKNINPQTLLDVGSGRGVFLFPFIKEFPNTIVESIDVLDYRVNLINCVKMGGIKNLNASQIDITKYEYEENKYDCVTMLEVLEHIPNVETAIKNAIKLTKKFIVITVPSKKDDNPEHIHLLTKEKLTQLFNKNGITNLKFGGVNGHLFLVATK